MPCLIWSSRKRNGLIPVFRADLWNRKFLAEILNRKLAVVAGRYYKSQLEFERYAVLAISSIYGIDILQDNVYDCRENLHFIFDTLYTSLYGDKCKIACKNGTVYSKPQHLVGRCAKSENARKQASAYYLFGMVFLSKVVLVKKGVITFEELTPRHQTDLFYQPLRSRHRPNCLYSYSPAGVSLNSFFTTCG